jgi:hypothetical protein
LECRAEGRGEAPAEAAAVWAIRFFLDEHRRVRDRVLFDLAIDSKLRGCDVVKVKIGDLVLGRQFRSGAIVVQAKTGKPVQFEVMQDTGPVSWHGWSGVRLGSMTTSSQVASTMPTT